MIYCYANPTAVSEGDLEKIISENQAILWISQLLCSEHTDVLYLLRAVETEVTRMMIVAARKGRASF